jgi:anti-sigma factor RsiW
VSALGRLSPQDLERLSAYADGALSPREQKEFITRLEVDTDLQQGLAELRALKRTMGALPEQRVPRNFTLQPGQVERRTAGRLFPTLRLATVFASVLFVVTTFLRAAPASYPMSAAAPAAEMAQEFRAADEASEPAATQAPLEAGAEAPSAAPSARLDDHSVPTGTPAATPCPDCLNLFAEANSEPAPATSEVSQTAEALGAAPIEPLTAAQLAFGLSAVALGLLTLRARRG